MLGRDAAPRPSGGDRGRGMFAETPVHVVLFEPEIPPNTGNVARLCSVMETPLHLVEPLGFSLDDGKLRRAGLDYWPELDVRVWPDMEAYLAGAGKGRRMVAATAKSAAGVSPLQNFSFLPGDSLIFGPETRGLPAAVLERCACRVRIPMRNTARSLNLSTAVGIVLYAALAGLRMLDFAQRPPE
jgi:tRNA (cytidine/uridine-2'-O-)-methyltransferase